MNDELIQKLLDEGQGQSLPENPDTRSYRQLFELLDSAESYSPEAGFAHRVTAALDKKESKSTTFSLVLTVSLVAVILVLSVVAIMVYYQLSIPISNMTGSLIIMFALGLFLSALYRLIEKRFLHS